MEKIIKNHSEGIRNYIKSIIEIGEPVEKKEFLEIYKKLSKGKNKYHNALNTSKRLSKEKLVKFI